MQLWCIKYKHNIKRLNSQSFTFQSQRLSAQASIRFSRLKYERKQAYIKYLSTIFYSTFTYIYFILQFEDL